MVPARRACLKLLSLALLLLPSTHAGAIERFVRRIGAEQGLPSAGALTVDREGQPLAGLERRLCGGRLHRLYAQLRLSGARRTASPCRRPPA
jgi:hypothetical protein